MRRNLIRFSCSSCDGLIAIKPYQSLRARVYDCEARQKASISNRIIYRLGFTIRFSFNENQRYFRIQTHTNTHTNNLLVDVTYKLWSHCLSAIRNAYGCLIFILFFSFPVCVKCILMFSCHKTIHNDTIDIWIEMPYAIHCSVFSILISRKTDYIYRRSNTQHRLASISVMLSSCFQLVYLWLCSTIHGINTAHERTKGNVCRDREKDKEQTTITCICV